MIKAIERYPGTCLVEILFILETFPSKPVEFFVVKCACSSTFLLQGKCTNQRQSEPALLRQGDESDLIYGIPFLTCWISFEWLTLMLHKIILDCVFFFC